MANVVDIVIRARDFASANFLNIDRVAGRMFASLAQRAAGALPALGKLAIKIGAIASTAVSIIPVLIPAIKAVYQFGAAAVQAAPMLLAFAAAGFVVKSALTAIFQHEAFKDAMKPLTDGFSKAKDTAAFFATQGLKPIVAEFNDVVWEEVNHTFYRIGTSVNRVAKEFLNWGKSAEGAATIDNILHPIWQTLERLEPSITRVSISFFKMLGRIMGVSMEIGGNGLEGLLNKLADAMDKIDAESVSEGFNKLASDAKTVANAISTVAEWIRTLIGWYIRYQTEFYLLADAVSILAIVFGGPVVAVIAAVGLIIRHWDDLKAAYETLTTFFTETEVGVGFLDNLQAFAEGVMPNIEEAFNSLRDAVLPVFEEIRAKLMDEFVPALGEFIAACEPVVSFFVDHFGPWIARTFENLLNIISGIISIIIGIFQLFTGILTGDWSKAWEGIVNIFSGAGQVLIGIASQIWNNITAIFNTLGDALWNAIKSAGNSLLDGLEWLGEQAKGALKWVWDWAWGIGKDIVNGIIGGLKSIGGSITSTLKSFIPSPSSLVSWVPGLASGGIASGAMRQIGRAAEGGVRGAATMINEQGPEIMRLPNGTMAIPHGSSEAMMAAMSRNGGGGRTILELRAGSSPLDQILLEILKKAIRLEGGNVQLVLGEN